MAPGLNMYEPRPLSPTEKVIYEAIVRAADTGAVCPTNNEIAEIGGFSSIGKASEMLGRIECKGWIVVHRGQCRRIVMIVKSGRFTAGEMPKPHWRDQGKPPKIAAQHIPRLVPAKTVEPTIERSEIVPAPVDREPCFMCGTRADIGCKHRKAA